MKRAFALVLIGVLLGVVPAGAHHSFDAVFDAKKPVTIVGIVTRIEWGNPHMWYYLEVKDKKGVATKWGFECHSPNLLIRAGWKKDSMKIGDHVTVTGFLARDGSNRASTNTVVKEDGTVIYKGLGDTVSGK